MSYRSVKKLLGETSLERKFRFLFGGGLLLLIAGGFWFADRMNKSLVEDLNRRTAQMLVPSVIMEKHLKWNEPDPNILKIYDNMDQSLKSKEETVFQWKVYNSIPSMVEPNERPDNRGYIALEKLRSGADWDEDIQLTEGFYNYYAPLRASKSCTFCHEHQRWHVKAGSSDKQSLKIPPLIQDGELIGMAKISLPLDETQKALNTNSAYLWAIAIVIVAMAMTAAYAIVRYIIVKPVLHLKDVSDEIAHGVLDRRADIRTGDEFEELSHAFNRMLRHLTTVQDELRQVNSDLDAKVDELAHVNLSLYEMNKMKDEFLATMSHELRTPLNSILGFSDVLSASDNLNEKQCRFVQNIQTSGHNLMVLINDLLDLAKIESGKMELQIVEFSLTDLVERQVATLMPLAEKKNIALTFEIDAELPLVLQDSGKLRQILNNLLSNAIKFTPEGGRVHISADRHDDETFNLIVEDTGIGIPLEEQDQIFEKFRQGKTVPGQRDTMTREYEGTGLGLSIVKELAKLLGGEVTLESEFGKGSTFLVHLPIQTSEERNLLEELHSRIVEINQPEKRPFPQQRPVNLSLPDATSADVVEDDPVETDEPVV